MEFKLFLSKHYDRKGGVCDRKGGVPLFYHNVFYENIFDFYHNYIYDSLKCLLS